MNDYIAMYTSYEDGYEAGKASAAEIIKELDTLLNTKLEAVSRIADRTFDSQTACLASGMADAYKDVKVTLEEIKTKYGVR